MLVPENPKLWLMISENATGFCNSKHRHYNYLFFITCTARTARVSSCVTIGTDFTIVQS